MNEAASTLDSQEEIKSIIVTDAGGVKSLNIQYKTKYDILNINNPQQIDDIVDVFSEALRRALVKTILKRTKEFPRVNP